MNKWNSDQSGGIKSKRVEGSNSGTLKYQDIGNGKQFQTFYQDKKPAVVGGGASKSLTDLSINLSKIDPNDAVTSSNNAIFGSNGVRGDITNFKNSSDTLNAILGDDDLGGVLNQETYNQTNAGSAEFDSMKNKLENLGIISTQDQRDINAAGEAAGSSFDSLINDAKQQKTAGMGKATVNGGEAGGFMNTQISGQAALTPINADSFVGAGGELERVQSIYDNNISNLKAQKIQAIQKAKTAAKQAVLTGKATDAKAAVDLYNIAKQSHDEMNALALEKIDTLGKIQDYRKKVLDADYDVNQRDYSDAMRNLDNMLTANSDLSAIPDGTKTAYEKQLGLQAGEFDDYFTALQEVKAKKDEATDLELASSINDILAKVPEDIEVDINGIKYNGLKTLTGSSNSTYKDALDIKSKELDIQKKLKTLNSSDLPSSTISQIDSVVKAYENYPIVKQFNEVQNKKLSIDAILGRKTGPGDLAAIFDFMKALDPGSVVRESEYATAATSGNVFLGALAKFNGLFKKEGQKLPDSVRKEFNAIINEKYNAVKSQYNNYRTGKAVQIDRKTGANDGIDYLIDFNFDDNKSNYSSPEEALDQSWLGGGSSSDEDFDW